MRGRKTRLFLEREMCYNRREEKPLKVSIRKAYGAAKNLNRRVGSDKLSSYAHCKRILYDHCQPDSEYQHFFHPCVHDQPDGKEPQSVQEHFLSAQCCFRYCNLHSFLVIVLSDQGRCGQFSAPAFRHRPCPVVFRYGYESPDRMHHGCMADGRITGRCQRTI